MGESSVVVIDARSAKSQSTIDAPTELLCAEGIRLHVVSPGDVFTPAP
jgi:hypothetical protein